MTDAGATPDAAIPSVGKTIVVALLMGLSIATIGTMSWVTLIRLNISERPDVPWAAVATGSWLVVMLAWLSGRGWPRRTSAARRFHLRLWRPQPGAWSGDSLTTILGLIGALVGLYVLYVLMGTSRPPADLSPYPTTAIRFSALLMAPLVAGVVEEMAFRGYMQSHLERIGPTFAILVTSAAFTLLHASHGLAYLLALAPGLFLASVVYGYLALKSGSILPGMALHFAGDLAFSYFALLGGDSARLFAH
ncbi:MAG: CPBP family intramembrane metalloprotease [Vicinamibacterales bacterium]|nr:CPBP family intramembrane metalloprotease [Vicinamibacterales bacterium]